MKRWPTVEGTDPYSRMKRWPTVEALGCVGLGTEEEEDALGDTGDEHRSRLSTQPVSGGSIGGSIGEGFRLARLTGGTHLVVGVEDVRRVVGEPSGRREAKLSGNLETEPSRSHEIWWIGDDPCSSDYSLEEREKDASDGKMVRYKNKSTRGWELEQVLLLNGCLLLNGYIF